VLYVQWLHYETKPLSIGIGKEKAAVTEKESHERFENGKDDYETLPGDKKGKVPRNRYSRLSFDTITQHGAHCLLS